MLYTLMKYFNLLQYKYYRYNEYMRNKNQVDYLTKVIMLW